MKYAYAIDDDDDDDDGRLPSYLSFNRTTSIVQNGDHVHVKNIS